MEKIIHIVQYAPYEGVIKLLFINETNRAGRVAEYWNIGPIVGNSTPSSARTQAFRYREFTDLDDLELAVQAEHGKRVLFNLQMNYCFDNRTVYQIFKKNNCLQSVISSGVIPVPNNCLLTRALIFVRNRSIFSPKIPKRILASLYKRWCNIPPPSIAFVAGRKASMMWKCAGIQVHINSVDYDDCLEIRPKSSASGPIVFLDQYLPYHPDFRRFGHATVNAKQYYAAMNSFFSKLEQKFGRDVEIAGHPKSNYQGEEFGGRKIRLSRSTELVNNAYLVIAHDSTAVGKAVFFRRPILLVFTNGMEVLSRRSTHMQLQRMKGMAKLLGAPLVNAEEEDEVSRMTFPKVSEEKYQSYLYEYMTWSDTERTNSCDVFVRYTEQA